MVIKQFSFIQDDLDSGPAAIAAARAETASVLSELVNQQAECQALSAKHRHLENLVRELRRDNVELREQVNRVAEEAEDENSLTESDKHTRDQSLQVRRSSDGEKPPKCNMDTRNNQRYEEMLHMSNFNQYF